MPKLTIIWDEEEGGNAEHIADNFLAYEDVQNALFFPWDKTFSRSSGLPLWKGYSEHEEEIAVIFRWSGKDTVYPVTAFRIRKED